MPQSNLLQTVIALAIVAVAAGVMLRQLLLFFRTDRAGRCGSACDHCPTRSRSLPSTANEASDSESNLSHTQFIPFSPESPDTKKRSQTPVP